MVKLIIPEPAYLHSYHEAFKEYKKLGLDNMGFFKDPDKYAEWSQGLFKRFDDYRKGINLPDGYIAASTFWLVDEEKREFIGEGAVRHELTPQLMCYGGHIGYAVRASAWNRGYGTLLLSLLLREAGRLGIECALVTCDDGNIGSRRVIEKNGGAYQDTVDNTIGGRAVRTRRYWVDVPAE
jgi:predicted acetyltransferase